MASSISTSRVVRNRTKCRDMSTEMSVEWELPAPRASAQGHGATAQGLYRIPLGWGSCGRAAPEARHALEHGSTGRRGGAKNRPIQPALARALVATARAISTAAATLAVRRGAGSGCSTPISRPCERSRESPDGADAQPRSWSPGRAGGSIPRGGALPNLSQSVAVGERAFNVTEELALEQRLGEGRAIDGHEWSRCPHGRAACRGRGCGLCLGA